MEWYNWFSKPVCGDSSEIYHCLLLISFGKSRFKALTKRSAVHDHRLRLCFVLDQDKKPYVFRKMENSSWLYGSVWRHDLTLTQCAKEFRYSSRKLCCHDNFVNERRSCCPNEALWWSSKNKRSTRYKSTNIPKCDTFEMWRKFMPYIYGT